MVSSRTLNFKSRTFRLTVGILKIRGIPGFFQQVLGQNLAVLFSLFAYYSQQLIKPTNNKVYYPTDNYEVI